MGLAQRAGIRRLWLGGGAFAGLVVAHCLSYFAVAPNEHHHKELLHATGHGNWRNMWVLAGAFFLAALIAFGSRWASPDDRDVPLRRLYRYAWLRLVPAQVVGFLVLEGAERLSKGTPLTEMAGEPVILWGLLLQVVVALVGGLLLIGFTRLVRALRSTDTPAPTRHHETFALVGTIVAPRSVARRAWNLRGPPALS